MVVEWVRSDQAARIFAWARPNGWRSLARAGGVAKAWQLTYGVSTACIGPRWSCFGHTSESHSDPIVSKIIAVSSYLQLILRYVPAIVVIWWLCLFSVSLSFCLIMRRRTLGTGNVAPIRMVNGSLNCKLQHEVLYEVRVQSCVRFGFSLIFILNLFQYLNWNNLVILCHANWLSMLVQRRM